MHGGHWLPSTYLCQVPVALGCCLPARQEPKNHQPGYRDAAGIGGTATSPRLLQKPCGGRALQGARPALGGGNK